MMKTENNGLVTISTKSSVPETMQRVESLLQERGVFVFARIDHSGEAEKIGLRMRPTKLLILGSPKGGTPLMQAAPTVAIDLPLKALFWEDAGGKVWLTYNDPFYLQRRHNIPAALIPNIAGVNALFQAAAE